MIVRKMALISKTHYKWIIPVIHSILCIIWSQSFFLSDVTGIKTAIVREGSHISDSAETMMIRIITYLFCALLIYWGWQLFFFVIDVFRGKEKRVSRSTLVLFGIIFLIGLFAGTVSYPDKFAIMIDNYTNYAQARGFVGSYWQSVYMGCLVGGCAMILHHASAIFLFQWTLFVVAIGFVFCGIDRLQKRNLKYCALILFLLPEAYYLTFDAYRNDIYAILLMIYLSYIFFALTLRRRLSVKELIGLAVFSTFMMVFRSEGLLIGITGIAFLLVYLRGQWKRSIVLVLVFVVSFVAIQVPVKLGTDKYFGQDYMILNTTPVLYSIFNDPSVDLSYAGAKKDLAAIEAVVPVQVLKEAGMTGFRNYNWMRGKKTFNQTLSSDETSEAYMDAYYSIIRHNPMDYLNVQLNEFFSSFGLTPVRTTYSYEGEPTVKLESFKYEKWKIGKELIFKERLTSRWADYPGRIIMRDKVDHIIAMWRNMFINTPLHVLLHVLSFILICILCVMQFVLAIIRRNWRRLGFAVLFLVIIGEYIAIMLFMPDDRPAYLYPTLYAGYLSILFYYAGTVHPKRDTERGDNRG